MLALSELQTRFAQAVLGGQEAELALTSCLVETGEVASRRIATYRRSIMGNLTGAMLATYPVLTRIVGLPFFRAAAHAYIDSYASLSGDLNDYGHRFAEFLTKWPHASDLPYLPDVARLEWLVQQIYYAAEGVGDFSTLIHCNPADYGELRFVPNPALARLDSRWPLDAIWRVNADGYEGQMALDFTLPCQLAIVRSNGLVHVHALTPAMATLVDALAVDKSLTQAGDAALDVDPGFDLGQSLSDCMSQALFLRVLLPATTQENQP